MIQYAAVPPNPSTTYPEPSSFIYPVLFRDDLEGPGTLQWTAAGGGTAAKAANGHAMSGNMLQVVTTAVNGNVTSAAAFAPYQRFRFRSACWFFFDATNGKQIFFQATRLDGVNYADMILRYDTATGQWNYKSSDTPTTYLPIPNLPARLLQTLAWQYLEWGGNFETQAFEYIRMGGLYVPMSGIKGTAGASASLAATQIVVAVQTNAAAASTVNFDDFFVAAVDPI